MIEYDEWLNVKTESLVLIVSQHFKRLGCDNRKT